MASRVRQEIVRSAAPGPLGLSFDGTDERDPWFYEGVAGVAAFALGPVPTSAAAEHVDDLQVAADLVLPAIETLGAVSPTSVSLHAGLAGVAIAADRICGCALAEDQLDAREAADAIVQALCNAAMRPTSRYRRDVIGGDAGLLLALLELSNGHQECLASVQVVASRLLASADFDETPFGWLGSDDDPGITYLNFAHGIAGIAFALARASATTGDDEQIHAAVRAAEALRREHSPHLTASGVMYVPRFVRHDSTVADSRSILNAAGWCHGGAGTSALWLELYEQTTDPKWLEPLEQFAALARICVDSARGNRGHEGHGASASICHGLAGISIPLLQAAGRLDRRDWVDAADELIDLTIDSAAETEGGLRWRELAKVRNSAPDDDVRHRYSTPVGYMVGAAGTAAALGFYASTRATLAQGELMPEQVGYRRS